MTVDVDAETAPSCAAGPGGEGELHRSLQAFVDRERVADPAAVRAVQPADLGYALHRLLPETATTWRGCCPAAKAGSRRRCGRRCALTPLPAAKVLCVLGFGDSITSADCVPVVLRPQPADDGVHQQSIWSSGCRRRSAARPDRRRACPRDGVAARGDGRRRSASAAAIGPRAEDARPGLRDSGSPASRGRLVTDPGGSGGAVAMPDGRRRARDPAGRRRRGVGRLGGRRRTAGASRRLPARPRRAAGAARSVRCVVRALR